MIHELRIRALGVIDEAVIPFAPGLTVLTGETGAGKTMVLTGLGLIRGGKADAGLVRTGAEHADVDAEWRLRADPADVGSRAVLDRVEEAGGSCEADGDDVVLLLGRSVAAGGRSRAFAGGRSVPASILAELGEHLMAVHGQADQLLIRDPRRQRELLDLFAGREVLALRAGYAADFAAWRACCSSPARPHRAPPGARAGGGPPAAWHRGDRGRGARSGRGRGTQVAGQRARPCDGPARRRGSSPRRPHGR